MADVGRQNPRYSIGGMLHQPVELSREALVAPIENGMVLGGVLSPSGEICARPPPEFNNLSKILRPSTSSLGRGHAHINSENQLKRPLALSNKEQRVQAKLMKWKEGPLSKYVENPSFKARVLGGDNGTINPTDFPSQRHLVSHHTHHNQHCKQDNGTIPEKLTDRCDRESLTQEGEPTILHLLAFKANVTHAASNPYRIRSA